MGISQLMSSQHRALRIFTEGPSAVGMKPLKIAPFDGLQGLLKSA